ncbi:MAG TPA: hypothetical protein PLB45_00930 [Bacilli bacterium]|nr:hypothetical protein [Bacilli bacterium]HPZ23541.1 hypothetical protein [Bacilli bacterium]HQC83424.1 hypothetical protein [Bacilli bacterium]
MKFNNKKLLIIISSLIALVVIGAIIFVINKSYSNYVKSNESEIYGTISSIQDGSILVSPTEGNVKEIELKMDDISSYNVGDLILITYMGNINSDNYKVDVILSGAELTTTAIVTTEEVAESTTTSKVVTTSSERTTSVITSSSTTLGTNDEKVISYMEKENQYVSSSDTSSSFKENAKKVFITVVDFIFYGGKINGVTFNQLSNSAKAKVVYYALIIDNKINDKFPDYKNELADKYKDVKARLIANYLDITTELCESNTDACSQARDDFSLLKTSLHLTWDIVKSAAKYAYNTTKTNFSSWYKTFKGA